MKLLLGDCIEKMKELPENSVDTIITDPPYGLNFMGKDWDKFGKDKNPAGGNTGKDTPYARNRVAPAFYHYGTEEKMALQKFFYTWCKEALRVLKPGGTMLCFGGSRTFHRVACGIEDSGFILKDCIMWLYGSGFPKATDISKQLDKGVERKVVGSYKATGTARNKTHIGAKTHAAIGEYEVQTDKIDITEPSTPEAKLWNGWKSHGLKPAYEPILVAMKPNEGSYAQNALEYGVSGLNIDGGRIKTAPDDVFGGGGLNSKGDGFIGKSKTPYEKGMGFRNDNKQGRFPANIILDEEAGKMLDEQSGITKANYRKPPTLEKGGTGSSYVFKGKKDSPQDYADKGGASRFFYCAKASKSERNMGCEGLEVKESKTMSERKPDFSGDSNNTTGQNPSLSRNNHPTVKPIKLMEYLCILTKTPTGGVVLDCFMGSGSTGVACVNTDREFIGIEKEPEYMEIAKKRIEYATQKRKERLF